MALARFWMGGGIVSEKVSWLYLECSEAWPRFLAAVQKKKQKTGETRTSKHLCQKNKEVEGVFEFAAVNTEIDV